MNLYYFSKKIKEKLPNYRFTCNHQNQEFNQDNVIELMYHCVNNFPYFINELNEAIIIASIGGKGEVACDNCNYIFEFYSAIRQQKLYCKQRQCIERFENYLNMVEREGLLFKFSLPLSKITTSYACSLLFSLNNRRFILNNDDPIEQLSSAVMKGNDSHFLYYDVFNAGQWIKNRILLIIYKKGCPEEEIERLSRYVSGTDYGKGNGFSVSTTHKKNIAGKFEQLSYEKHQELIKEIDIWKNTPKFIDTTLIEENDSKSLRDQKVEKNLKIIEEMTIPKNLIEACGEPMLRKTAEFIIKINNPLFCYSESTGHPFYKGRPVPTFPTIFPKDI